MRSQKPEWQQRIAKERIDILFFLAEKEFAKNPNRSKAYVKLARKIGTRYNVRLSKEEKARFCKNCDTLLIVGKTSTVRLDSKSKTVLVKCENCGKIYRESYKRGKQ